MQKQTYITPKKPILVTEWQKTFGRPSPPGCHPSLLDKAIAWQKQANQQGGLALSERRQLLGDVKSGSSGSSGNAPNVGMRLVRVWQGETHQVTVLDSGYLYAEQRWKSLSAIAKAITGTPWSGPVFFGIKK